MKETISFHIMALYRDFLSYTTKSLKDLGVSFGQMPLILYVGKHSGCSQADLTRNLHLDWGYSQRSITKLSDLGFIRKEYDEKQSCNCLTLTESGMTVFDTSHTVFQSWDQLKTNKLSADEKETLIFLLSKLSTDIKESC